MKYLFDYLPEIEKKIRGRALLLMFDFDGTLSPLAPAPGRARFPAPAKRELKKCSRFFPVVIVSGRSLKDIENKAGVKNIAYSGNHGLEWKIGKKTGRILAAKKNAESLTAAEKKLEKILPAYPGALLENKNLSLAVHYRSLAPALVRGFKKDIARIIKPLCRSGRWRILKGKKVVELNPNSGWNKGKFILFVRRYFQNKTKLKILPVYAGDDATDEDAFRALKSGITIKIGQSKKSRANYYLKNPGQLAEFLSWLNKMRGKKTKRI